MAGSITAALVPAALRHPRQGAHVHFDIFAWNNAAKPGRPEGGEVQAARLIYALLKERYGADSEAIGAVSRDRAKGVPR